MFLHRVGEFWSSLHLDSGSLLGIVGYTVHVNLPIINLKKKNVQTHLKCIILFFSRSSTWSRQNRQESDQLDTSRIFYLGQDTSSVSLSYTAKGKKKKKHLKYLCSLFFMGDQSDI